MKFYFKDIMWLLSWKRRYFYMSILFEIGLFFFFWVLEKLFEFEVYLIH